MEKESRNKRIVLGVILIAVVVVTIAGTFAYFVSNTQVEPEKLTVTTGTLALTFADNNAGVSAKLDFGETVTKTFTIKNTGDRSAEAQISWKNLVNTYGAESLTYTLVQSTTETGTYNTVETMSANVPRSETPTSSGLSKGLVIPAGATYYYTLTIKLEYLDDVDQTNDLDATFNSEFDINIYNPTALDKIMLSANSGNPDFSKVATTDEGVYTMADDYGTSYYYRGAVTNNYVKFGKWATGTENAGKDMYWRIIRINGDGSLRMIYDGTSAHANGENNADRVTHTGQAYNSNHDDNAYVGWMYGTTGGTKEEAQTNTNNSPIKDLVNAWYDQNLASYDTYIADAVYCNDRSTPGKDATGWSIDTGLGYAKNSTAYGAVGRLVNGITWTGPKNPSTPQFTCPQKNDAFTVSDSVHGNAIGTDKSRKIGLITADEVVTAGALYGAENSNYYLYKGSMYWTLSPCNYNGSTVVFAIFGKGHIQAAQIYPLGTVAPVISIKANYASTMTGTGTAGDPYVIPSVA